MPSATDQTYEPFSLKSTINRVAAQQLSSYVMGLLKTP